MQVTDRLPRETARDYAFRTIKENIVELELSPGSMVSENELAVEMGISRTPVREALIELSKSHIVEIFPQKGSYVSKIDDGLVEEARFMRLVLETAITGLVCEMANKEDLFLLDKNIKLQVFYRDELAYEKLFELDNQFHRELFRIGNKLKTYDLMDSMMVHFDRVRKLGTMAANTAKNVEDHIKIFQAVSVRDVDHAKKQMEKHLSRYQSDRKALRSFYPEYFKA